MHTASDLASLPVWLTERPIAHRGLHDANAPENSLAAFSAACDAGYPIELDVQILGDGTLVVFHDEQLARATGSEGLLFDEDRESIRGRRLFASDQTIPRLDEVFAEVRGRVPILIELKKTRWARGLERAVDDAIARYRGPVAVQSFDPTAVFYFRRHAQAVLRGQLAGPLWDDDLSCFSRFAAHRMLSMPATRPHFINFDLRGLPDPWVSALSRAFAIPILCWTVRSEADRRKAEQLGANYVFDHIRP